MGMINWIGNRFEDRRIRRLNSMATKLADYGETEFSYELEEANQLIEYARRRYEYLEEMYDYSEERKEQLEEKIDELKAKKKEFRGRLPFPILLKKLRDAFWRTGITKKGREFKKLERKIDTAERALKRMNKNGTKRWEEMIKAEEELEMAEENYRNIENNITKRYKELKRDKKTEKENVEQLRDEDVEIIKDEDIEIVEDEEKEENREENENMNNTTEEKENMNEKNEEEKKTKKNKFNDDLDMRVFTKNGIDINSFEKAVNSVNIDLKPKECLLFMGILQLEFNKNKYETKEDAIEATKKIANEVYRKIKTGEIEEYEESADYYMDSGMHVFKKSNQDQQNLSSAELLAQKIAMNYENIKREKDENTKNKQYNQNKEDRTA